MTTIPTSLKEVEVRYGDNSRCIHWVASQLYTFEACCGQGDLKKMKNKASLIGFLDASVGSAAQEGIFAYHQNAIIGGLTFHVHKDWIFIDCGYVEEAFRGKGIYTELLQIVLKAAKKYTLGVFVSTYTFEAPALYEKMGFIKGNIMRDCPKGNTSIDYYINPVEVDKEHPEDFN